jgi:hypothetical protein
MKPVLSNHLSYVAIFHYYLRRSTVYRIKILLNKTNFRNVADYFADKKTEGNIQ